MRPLLDSDFAVDRIEMNWVPAAVDLSTCSDYTGSRTWNLDWKVGIYLIFPAHFPSDLQFRLNIRREIFR